MIWIRQNLPMVTLGGVTAAVSVGASIFFGTQQSSQVERQLVQTEKQLQQTEREYANQLDVTFSEYASRVTRLEEQLKQLSGSLTERDMQLTALRAELAKQAPIDLSALDAFEERLKLVERRRQSSSVSVDSVADVLMRDYAQQLRGPKGDPGPAGPMGARGPAGPQGAAGEAGSGGTVLQPMQDPDVLANFAFTSDFETKRMGDLQVDLVECLNGGSSVHCEFQVEWLGEGVKQFRHDGSQFRIATEDSSWYNGSSVSMLNSSNNSWVEHDFIPKLPVRVRVDFKGVNTRGVGMPFVRYCTLNCWNETTWSNVAFAN